MAAFVFTPIAQLLATAALDLSAADIRCKALMSNTTAGSEEDAAALDEITTLDEYDGVGYTEATLASITVTSVIASDRTQVDAANGTFGATVAAGTRPATALLFYIYVDGDPANDLPLMFDDTPSSFPYTGDGSSMPLQFAATGFLHIAA